MEARENDVNLRVETISRDNSVFLSFSDRKSKQFIFSARKRLRPNPGDGSIDDLFITDNITLYNC